MGGSALKGLGALEGTGGKGIARGKNEWVDKLWALVDAVDTYIPTPQREVEKPFLMAVEDIFTITGRGTVATGRVERGKVKVGEEVEIVGLRAQAKKTVVTGIEMFRKTLDEAVAGDNVGVLLRGVEKEEIERGMVLITPVALEGGLRFAIREGGRTVGAGAVAKVME